MFASLALVTGCGTQAVDDAEGDGTGVLAGLDDCGSPGGLVAAFWGADEGVGFPDDSADAPTGGDIWSMTADGQVAQVTDDARSRDPSLSDDARRLYYTRSDGGLTADVASPGTELWVLDLETGDQSMIFDAGTRTGFNEVEESPDGRAIAFSAHLEKAANVNPRVYVMSLEPRGEPIAVPLRRADELYPWQMQTSPTWSPDGTQLAYVLVEGDESTGLRSSLRVVDRGTGEDVLLYQAPDERSYLHNLQWSADGSAFVAVAKGDRLQEGFTAVSIDADSGKLTVLADAVPEPVTAASPNGGTVSSIGLTIERINQPDAPLEPVLTSWGPGEVSVTEKLPVTLSFATQLTIADCSFTPLPLITVVMAATSSSTTYARLLGR